MGADKALQEGLVKILDYPKLVSAIDLYKHRTEKIPDLQGPLTNVWLYGQRGTYKTTYVQTEYPMYYDKDKSKYWNGYTNQEIVMVDDIEQEETFMLGNLKKWAQHKPFPGEDKYGGFKVIRPKTIIVTSNYHPDEIWKNTKEVEPISRRFKIIKLDPIDPPEWMNPILWKQHNTASPDEHK